MKFLKKNAFFIIAMAFIAVLYLFPTVKLKLKDLFFPIAEIEDVVKVPDEDMDVDLLGINVSSTNLKALKKDKLIFAGAAVALIGTMAVIRFFR